MVDELRLLYGEMSKYPQYAYTQDLANAIQAPIGRVHAIIARAVDSDAVYIRLIVAHASGQMATTGELLLKPPPRPVNDQPSATASGNKIEPTPLAEEMLPHNGAFRKDRAAAEALQNALAHPEARDPLDLVLGYTLAETARIRNRQLIACIPDAAFAEGNHIFSRPVASENVFALLRTLGMVPEEEGNLMLVEPARPACAIDARIDRIAFGKFVRSIIDQGTPTFEAIADYTDHRPFNCNYIGFERGCIRLLNDQSAFDFYEHPLAGWISVARDCPPDLMAAMARNRISFADLPPALRQRLIDTYSKPSVWEDGLDGSWIPAIVDVDATDLIDPGMLSGASVSFHLDTNWRLGNYGDDGQNHGMNFLQEVATSHWNDQGVVPAFTKGRKFKPVRNRHLQMHVRFGHPATQTEKEYMISFEAFTEDFLSDTSAAPTAFEKLPNEILDAIRKEYSAHKGDGNDGGVQ